MDTQEHTSEGGRDDACCEAWKPGIEAINGAIILGWNHGYAYTQPPFRFCPWCGAERPPRDEPQEDAEEIRRRFRAMSPDDVRRYLRGTAEGRDDAF